MKNIGNSPAFKFLFFLLIGFIPASIVQFNFLITIVLAFCFIFTAIFFYYFSKKFHFTQELIDYKKINYKNRKKLPQEDSTYDKSVYEDLYKILSYGMIAIATGLLISFQARSDSMIDNKIIGKEFKGNFNGITEKVMLENPKFTRILAKGDMRLQNFDELKNQIILLTIFTKPTDSLNINSGDKISAIIRFKYPRSANLPQEFNEQSYLKYLDADFSATCSAKAFHFKSKNYSITFKEQILNAIDRNINKMYSQNTSGIAKALTIGDQSDISKEVRNVFSITGTTHILSVSGLHVGIIAGAILWLFSFIKNDWLKFIMVILSLAAYVYLIDFPASAVRAGLMITLYLFAITIQRPTTPLNIVSATAVFLLIISPRMAFNAGFQMSMGAIIGITIFYEPMRNFFKQFIKKENAISKFIIDSLSMTFSSSIIVSPIVAYYFKIFSIISSLANLLTIPLMVGAQIFALISIILSFIYLPFAQLLVNTSQLLIEIAEVIMSYAAKLPISHISGESVFPIALCISFFLLYLFLAKSKSQFAFRFVVSIFCMLMIVPIFSENKSSMKYYSREQVELLEIKMNTIRKDFVIISKNNQINLKKDYGLYKYIQQSGDKAKIYLDKAIFGTVLNFPNIDSTKIIFIKNSILEEKFFKNRNRE